MPIDTLLKSDQAKSALNGFLGGAAGGAVVSAFTNKKSAKKLLKTGGLVALGGVAWSAYQKYRDNGEAPTAQGPQDEPVATAYEQPNVPAQACLSEQALFRAMAAAAFADGHIDEEEQSKIWQQALDAGVEGQALTNLDALLKNPPGLADIVAEATDMASKLEIYTASVLVIDDTCADGAAYISRLKTALALPLPLTDAVDARLSV